MEVYLLRLLARSRRYPLAGTQIPSFILVNNKNHKAGDIGTDGGETNTQFCPIVSAATIAKKPISVSGYDTGHAVVSLAGRQ